MIILFLSSNPPMKAGAARRGCLTLRFIFSLSLISVLIYINL
jgi:hypothetical protein